MHNIKVHIIVLRAVFVSNSTKIKKPNVIFIEIVIYFKIRQQNDLHELYMMNQYPLPLLIKSQAFNQHRLHIIERSTQLLSKLEDIQLRTLLKQTQCLIEINPMESIDLHKQRPIYFKPLDCFCYHWVAPRM